MYYALEIHRVDPAREDLYLASVQDQEAVISDAEGFRGRSVLRSQVDRGVYWLLDAWVDQDAMRMAMAAARTLASVGGLIEQPRQLALDGEEVASGTLFDAAGTVPFFMASEAWVKAPCVADYLATIRSQGRKLAEAGGFRRRLLLTDRDAEAHHLVVDHWASEEAAYESYQSRQTPEIEATRFLSLLAERGRPLLATGLKVSPEFQQGAPT